MVHISDISPVSFCRVRHKSFTSFIRSVRKSSFHSHSLLFSKCSGLFSFRNMSISIQSSKSVLKLLHMKAKWIDVWYDKLWLVTYISSKNVQNWWWSSPCEQMKLAVKTTGFIMHMISTYLLQKHIWWRMHCRTIGLGRPSVSIVSLIWPT